jgi:hypothetical protein
MRASRWFLAAGLCGLSLMLAASGCLKNGKDESKDATTKNPTTQEAVNTPVTPPTDDTPAAKETTEIRHEAVFMGTRAVGQRFCIIADASNSMRGTPLTQLKKEVLQTLDGLNPASQFYVIFFNATDIPMPFPGWLDASKENVDKVRPWVQNMNTALQTRPRSAFERAFKLQPKPDAIFFMTDGFLHGKNPDPVTHVTRLNKEKDVAIHTIMFSKAKAAAKLDAAANQLRSMAEKNGGTFRDVKQK